MNKEYIDYISREIQELKERDFLKEIFYLDVKSWLPDNLLTLADKMSMVNSLDLFLPFCNDKILDLSTSIPFELKIKGLQSKYILVKTLGRLLPSPILNRKRQGFTVPIGRWLKDKFKDIQVVNSRLRNKPVAFINNFFFGLAQLIFYLTEGEVLIAPTFEAYAFR